MSEKNNWPVASLVAALPSLPGVYQFKNAQGEVIYVGKAKNLKKRVQQYLAHSYDDVKAHTILQESMTLDHTVTDSEISAMVLEATLIQSLQPKCNVLLKTGQPFLYIFIPSRSTLPSFQLVRNKKKQGTYFGPFMEKHAARKVVEFLQKTFRLRLCKRKIPTGCLYYHMGQCAGMCRDDFDRQAYQERFDLAVRSLRDGHKKFLEMLREQIEHANQRRAFEKSRELHGYLSAFEKVYHALDSASSHLLQAGKKEIWIALPDQQMLFVFSEHNGAIKKREAFFVAWQQPEQRDDLYAQYFESYYRVTASPQIILLNFTLSSDQRLLYEGFFKQWHKRESLIITPVDGHFAALVRLATIHAEQELIKRAAIGFVLKTMLGLAKAPSTIDCFDISHKQGLYMVGSCVRFKDGQPEPALFRHFHIKTLDQQNDYAALREIVQRRYADGQFPDLVVIDGGKGQLNAVKDLLLETECISLAKREETVFSDRLSQGKVLDSHSLAGQMLIALRDYTHHFAIQFHRKTETKKVFGEF